MILYDRIEYALKRGYNIDFFIEYLKNANDLIIEDFFDSKQKCYKETYKNSFIKFCEDFDLFPYFNDTKVNISNNSIIISKSKSTVVISKSNNGYIIKTSNLYSYDDAKTSFVSFKIDKSIPFFDEFLKFKDAIRDDFIKVYDIKTSSIDNLYFNESKKFMTLIVAKDYEKEEDAINSLIIIGNKSRFYKSVDAFYNSILNKQNDKILTLKRRN